MISIGIILGLLSTLAFGLLDTLVSFTTRVLNLLQSLIIGQLVSIYLFLGYLFLVNGGLGISLTQLPLLLFVGAGLGAINALADLCLCQGLRRHHPGKSATPTSPLAPGYGLVTMVLALFLLHESLSLLHGILVALILGGIVLTLSQSNPTFPSLLFTPLARVYAALFAGAVLLSGITAVLLSFTLRWIGMENWLVLFSGFVEGGCLLLACCLALIPSLHTPPQQTWQHKQLASLICTLGATLGFGVEYFLLSVVSSHLGPLQPLLWSRLGSVCILLFSAYRTRVAAQLGKMSWRLFGFLALVGLLETLGIALYTVGTGLETTSIVAALSSTYPILPLIVGITAYRRSLTYRQWGGVCVMAAGVIGLSLI